MSVLISGRRDLGVCVDTGVSGDRCKARGWRVIDIPVAFIRHSLWAIATYSYGASVLKR